MKRILIAIFMSLLLVTAAFAEPAGQDKEGAGYYEHSVTGGHPGEPSQWRFVGTNPPDNPPYEPPCLSPGVYCSFGGVCVGRRGVCSPRRLGCGKKHHQPPLCRRGITRYGEACPERRPHHRPRDRWMLDLLGHPMARRRRLCGKRGRPFKGADVPPQGRGNPHHPPCAGAGGAPALPHHLLSMVRQGSPAACARNVRAPPPNHPRL